MDDDELIERIFDDEVPLAAEGLFINGVDPPGDDGGPVIVTLATDDPAHAEQLMRARYGGLLSNGAKTAGNASTERKIALVPTRLPPGA